MFEHVIDANHYPQTERRRNTDFDICNLSSLVKNGNGTRGVDAGVSQTFFGTSSVDKSFLNFIRQDDISFDTSFNISLTKPKSVSRVAGFEEHAVQQIKAPQP